MTCWIWNFKNWVVEEYGEDAFPVPKENFMERLEYYLENITTGKQELEDF